MGCAGGKPRAKVYFNLKFSAKTKTEKKNEDELPVNLFTIKEVGSQNEESSVASRFNSHLPGAKVIQGK